MTKMHHHARVSALIPASHRHLDPTTIAETYLPRLHHSFTNQRIAAQVHWINGGAVELAAAYEAEPSAEQSHHLRWLNATLAAAQQAGLQVIEAYVTRSLSMALVGCGAGAAGGYKTGGPLGAFVAGLIGLVVGDLFRTHVPIYRAEYSQYYGWRLVPVQQVDPRTFKFGLA